MSDIINNFINSPKAMLILNAIMIMFIYSIVHNEPLPKELNKHALPYIFMIYLILFSLLSLFYYRSDKEKSRKIVLYSSIPFYVVIGFIIVMGRNNYTFLR